MEKVVVHRDMSRNPLFDVTFLINYELESRKEISKREPKPGELKISPYHFEKRRTKYDLSLIVYDEGEYLRFGFEYCTKLFLEETIKKLTGYFKQIVGCVLANPNVKIADIEIIPGKTRKEKLNYFNESLTGTSEIKPIQTRLSDVFQKYRKKTAVEYGTTQVTYGELKQRAASISKLIADHNIKKGSSIGIYMEDKIKIISAIIGILNRACIFVPLDTILPIKRIENMIRQVDTRVLLTDGRHETLLPGIKKNTGIANTFVVDESFYETRESAKNKAQPIRYDLEDKVYTYFTSGTAGKPNAVVGKNKSLIQFIEWEIETFFVDETYRISQLAAVGFDAFLRNVFTPLCAGGTVCIPETRDLIMNGGKLADWIDGNRITLVHCVPSLFRIINREELTGAVFSHLKYVLLSGEPVHVNELKRWYRIFSDRIQLVNCYGATETTIIKTFHSIRQSDVEGGRIPAGLPMRGARVIILDKHMKVCDRGIRGEIYIRTAYGTHGYLDNPELTARRFIKNPFSHNNGAVIYKTGDLGKELENGEIELLGRVDRQVKIRGIRIELEDIENCLHKHSKIEKPVVISRKDGNDENYLCAYIVYKKDTEGIPAASELREHLSKELPGYMIPSYFVQIEKVPLTPNGKIDEKALPDPEIKTGRWYIAPANGIEEILVEIWAEILGVEKDKISTEANFFDLGGHSLKATIMLAMMKKEFGIDISLVEIFKNPTVKRIGDLIKVIDWIDTGKGSQHRQNKIQNIKEVTL